jgi:hypothetical protein
MVDQPPTSAAFPSPAPRPRRCPGHEVAAHRGADQRRGSSGFVVVLLLGSATALFVAPSVLPASYSWLAHTTSEAAAQGVTGAWVARLGFLAFGFAVLLLAAVRRPVWGCWAAWLHAAFGVLMLAAAAFSSRSWDQAASFDPVEDLLHSVAATGMGFAFAIGVAVVGWTQLQRRRLRPLDVAAVLASVLLPLGMATSTGQAGLLQRVMFVVAYCWYAMEAGPPSGAPSGTPSGHTDCR